MTVSSTESRKTYAGDGVTTSFATNPVAFFDAADLTVYVVTTATGAVLATLVLNTDYTVSGGDGTTGTVDLSAGSAPYGAPASGTTLVIVRELDITQASDLVNNDGSDAEVVEDALDRLTMITQELDARIDRAFTLADSDISGASTELPTPEASQLIGWDSAGTALRNYEAVDFDTALTTAYTLTLLDDATAAEARTTLDAQEDVVTTKGDVVVGGAAGAATRKAVGTDGYILKAQSGATDGLQYLPPQAGFAIENGYLDWSAAASALTVAIKTEAGTDPSATDPVYIVFRSVTPGTGSLVRRKLTAATSIVLADTSTMGTANSTAFRLWCVAFDDGGTVRLALINCLSGTNIYPLAGWGIASATEETTGSDSAHVFYSNGAAVTSKAYATLGFASWESGLATAGTWSGAPTRAQLFGPGVPLPGHVIQTQRNDTGEVNTTTTQLPNDNTIPQNTEGGEFLSQAITPSSAANVLHITCKLALAHSAAAWTMSVALFQDATAAAVAASSQTARGAGDQVSMALDHRKLASTTSATTFKANAGGNAAGTTTFNGTASARLFGGVYNSLIQAQEIMA